MNTVYLRHIQVFILNALHNAMLVVLLNWYQIPADPFVLTYRHDLLHNPNVGLFFIYD